MDSDERFEFLLWLINRHDQLRASTANRAAIVVSANALLIAGVIFLIGNVFSEGTQYDMSTKTIIAVTGLISVLLLGRNMQKTYPGI